MAEVEHISRTSQQVGSSSHSDLSTGPQEENADSIKKVFTRKRKNTEHVQFLEMKVSLMEALKEMMNSEMVEIKNQNNKIIETNNEILKLLQVNAANYKELCERVECLETKNAAATDRISILEAQLNVIQKKMTKNTLEIRNIPQEHSENITEIVEKIYKTLKIQHVTNATMYRKGKNNAPIIVEYRETKEMEILMKAIRKYNGENKDNPLNSEHLGFGGVKSRVYISQALTPLSKKILAAGRELVKNGTYKYCWTSRGNVLLRKEEGQTAIVLNSLDQIRDLTSA